MDSRPRVVAVLLAVALGVPPTASAVEWSQPSADGTAVAAAGGSTASSPWTWSPGVVAVHGLHEAALEFRAWLPTEPMRFRVAGTYMLEAPAVEMFARPRFSMRSDDALGMPTLLMAATSWVKQRPPSPATLVPPEIPSPEVPAYLFSVAAFASQDASTLDRPGSALATTFVAFFDARGALYLLEVVACGPAGATRDCSADVATGPASASPSVWRPSSRRERALPVEVPMWFFASLALAVVALCLLRAGLPPLLPFFSRFQRDEVLEHERRVRLYEAIGANPGIVAKALLERTGLRGGAAKHHLDQLIHHGLVVVRRDGRTTRYFPAGPRVTTQAALAPTRARLLAILQARPGQSAQALAQGLGIRVQTTWEHLARMRERGLVRADRVGRGLRWTPVTGA